MLGGSASGGRTVTFSWSRRSASCGHRRRGARVILTDEEDEREDHREGDHEREQEAAPKHPAQRPTRSTLRGATTRSSAGSARALAASSDTAGRITPPPSSPYKPGQDGSGRHSSCARDAGRDRDGRVRVQAGLPLSGRSGDEAGCGLTLVSTLPRSDFLQSWR